MCEGMRSRLWGLLTATVERHPARSRKIVLVYSDLLDALLCHDIASREEDLYPLSA